MSDARKQPQIPKDPERHSTYLPTEKKSTKPFHPTPMLDQLEGGPWPSFVTGLKRLANENNMMVDLLGQLEHSYKTRLGYWKGGTVSVFAGMVIASGADSARTYCGSASRSRM